MEVTKTLLTLDDHIADINFQIADCDGRIKQERAAKKRMLKILKDFEWLKDGKQK